MPLHFAISLTVSKNLTLIVIKKCLGCFSMDHHSQNFKVNKSRLAIHRTICIGFLIVYFLSCLFLAYHSYVVYSKVSGTAIVESNETITVEKQSPENTNIEIDTNSLIEQSASSSGLDNESDDELSEEIIEQPISNFMSTENENAFESISTDSLLNLLPNAMTVFSGIVSVIGLIVGQKKYKWATKRVIWSFVLILFIHLLIYLVSILKLPAIVHSTGSYIIAYIACVLVVIPQLIKKEERPSLSDFFGRIPHDNISGIQLYNLFDKKNGLYTIEYLDSYLKNHFDANAISHLTYTIDEQAVTKFKMALQIYNLYQGTKSVETRDALYKLLNAEIDLHINELDSLPVNKIERAHCCLAFLTLIEKKIRDRVKKDIDLGLPKANGDGAIQYGDHDDNTLSSFSANERFISLENTSLGLKPDEKSNILINGYRLHFLPFIFFSDYYYTFWHEKGGFKANRSYVAFSVNLGLNKPDYDSTICLVIFEDIPNPCADNNIVIALKDIENTIINKMSHPRGAEANV